MRDCELRECAAECVAENARQGAQLVKLYDVRIEQVQAARPQVEAVGRETSGRSPGDCEGAAPPSSSTTGTASRAAPGNGTQASGGSRDEVQNLSETAAKELEEARSFIAETWAEARLRTDVAKAEMEGAISLARRALHLPRNPELLLKMLETLRDAGETVSSAAEMLKRRVETNASRLELGRDRCMAVVGKLQGRSPQKNQRQLIKNETKKIQEQLRTVAALMQDCRNTAAGFDRQYKEWQQTVSDPSIWLACFLPVTVCLSHTGIDKRPRPRYLSITTESGQVANNGSWLLRMLWVNDVG